MKKTILAAALLGAMAFTAQAANVTMYGSVDAGFAYKHDKLSMNGEQVGEKENSFKFADGLDGANKIGFKGEEDIGNAKVGFKLENQFTISNGEFKNSDKVSRVKPVCTFATPAANSLRAAWAVWLLPPVPTTSSLAKRMPSTVATTTFPLPS